MSTVNPLEEAKEAERATDGEPLGQWTLPSAPEVASPPPALPTIPPLPALPPPSPPTPSQANDGAFAAPGGPITEEVEEWALPPGSGGEAEAPGTGFRPIAMDVPPPASPLPGVALDPSVAGTPSGAFAPSRYDMNMLVPDPPAGSPVPQAPVAPPTPPSPPAEVGGGRWAAVPPPPPGAAPVKPAAEAIPPQPPAAETGVPGDPSTSFAFGDAAPADHSGLAKIAGVVALVVALVAGSFMVLTNRNEASGAPLHVSLQDGVTYRYRLFVSMNGSVSVAGATQPFDVSAVEDVSWKVTGHDANGVAKVEATVATKNMRSGGRSIGRIPVQRITFHVAPDGSVVAADGVTLLTGGSPQASFPGSDQILPMLPAHAVKLGDSWKSSSDQQLPYGLGTLHLSSTNYFIRKDTVRGRSTMVITGETDVPIDFHIDPSQLRNLGVSGLDVPGSSMPAVAMSGATKVNATAWFDPARGELVKSSASGHVDVTTKFESLPEDAPPGLEDGIRVEADVAVSVVELKGAPATGAGSRSTDGSAKASLRHALAAAKTFFATHRTYTGLTPRAAGRLDSSLAWRAGGGVRTGAVTIRVAHKADVLLLTRSSGGSWCIADVGGRTTYGRGSPAAAKTCAGGW